MKNIIAFTLLLLFVSSCKKETTQQDYSIMQNTDVPNTFSGINESIADQIYAAVAPQRRAFENLLEANYPGLKLQMDADYKIIATNPDSASAAIQLNTFIQTYHTPVNNTWQALQITNDSISNLYAAIFGNHNFTVGEFGTITAANYLPYAIPSGNYPAEATHGFGGSSDFSQQDGCSGAIGNAISNNANGSHVQLRVAPAGGCSISTLTGVSQSLPNLNYYFVSAKYRFFASRLNCTAYSADSACFVTADLTGLISLNGVAVNSRDLVSIGAMAPIGWFATVERTIPAGAEYMVSVRNDNSLPGGNYKMETKVTNRVRCNNSLVVSSCEHWVSRAMTTVFLSQ
ncbi:MAG: hypothetical protein NTY88_06910 [Bacteroidetes bacterium]|nr:hypothetical protein [Bacteroidota bacterium]